MESKTKNIVICSYGTGTTTIKGRGTNVFKPSAPRRLVDDQFDAEGIAS